MVTSSLCESNNATVFYLDRDECASPRGAEGVDKKVCVSGEAGEERRYYGP
jgi:hypothetical protein